MCAINTANELLNAMREAGFTINLNNDTLEVRQARWIDDELADLIRQHKAGLINILKDKNNENK